MKKIFKISNEQIKEMYLTGSSLNDIAKIAQDTKGLMALRRRLHDLGVDTNVSQSKYRYKLSKACHKYKLDEHVFDEIDNEETAYWLGFMMADGYNQQNKCAISLRLQEEDKEILIKFQQFLKTDAPIYTLIRTTNVSNIERKYCGITVCSPYLSEKLAALGCVQNKTYVLEYPNVPEELTNHFIRGYFDGDGCLSITKRVDRKSPTSKVYQFSITGREEFLQVLQDKLVVATHVTDKPLKTTSSNFAKAVRYNGFNVVFKLMNYLYKDATVYLQRKYDKYLDMVIRQSNLQ